MDWHGTDCYNDDDDAEYRIAESYDVNIFGRTDTGKSVALQVTGFNPYFYIKVPDDYATIQAAVNAAKDGDVIHVAAGLYKENLEINGKAVQLIGQGPRMTIIDGDNQGSVVTINNGQNQSTILLGFNIQNGNSDEFGGGILIEDSSPTIDRNIIQNNYAGSCGGAGGGIAIMGDSYPHIFGNKISNNTTSGDCDCDCY